MSIFLGVELGSTRVKAVAIDTCGNLLATGDFRWENQLIQFEGVEGGIWTYALDEAWRALRRSLSRLASDYKKKYGKPFEEIGAIGISAMMHGYLVFDKNDAQLTDFRTWRNTMTAQSAKLLSEAFDVNIPERWSIAHLHRAVAAGEPHVKDIAFMTSLAGYIHYKLTGEKIVGINEGSGIFPIIADSRTNDYDSEKIDKFDALISEYNMPWKLRDILPKVKCAGEHGGNLTREGLKLIDPNRRFSIKPGTPLCPPEGDAGTGMVATNTVSPGMGNISAGTSVFAMLTLDKKLQKTHPQIDTIATPMGMPVAMVHCNNFTSDLDAWVNMIYSVVKSGKSSLKKDSIYRILYDLALFGDPDCGGLVTVNYISGEHMTGFTEGRPLVVRMPDTDLSASNFLRSLIFSAMATLRMGMDILTKEEGIKISKLIGHGGFFKTPVVGQWLMAAALGIPIAVMESAGEGGPWGMALLAAYSAIKNDGETLEEFLNKRIFDRIKISTKEAEQRDAKGFERYFQRYKKALKVERAAIEEIK
ncbi:MAG: FGGY-family carbohydrate kinase [Oscillospiraceae bacterium]|nr:FGGY-family carbohydrate kinase [Oscillospiraceae bacterium]